MTCDSDFVDCRHCLYGSRDQLTCYAPRGYKRNMGFLRCGIYTINVQLKKLKAAYRTEGT